MSQVTTYNTNRLPVVARKYPPEGCPIKTKDVNCGETKGLDIITDFHELYQEKMKQIDVSAGGDNLQEKVDLQEDWINDLTQQNKLLAKVIEELENEAINRVQRLEDKLKNVVKSFGEEDKTDPAEKDGKMKEQEETEKISTPNEMTRDEKPEKSHVGKASSMKEIKSDKILERNETQESDEKSDEPKYEQEKKKGDQPIRRATIDAPTNSHSQSQIRDQKSVHLLIEDDEKSEIVEPEKMSDLRLGEIEGPRRVSSVPVVGTKDSLELLQNFRRSISAKSETIPSQIIQSTCSCKDKKFLEEIERLRKEYTQHEEEELQRLINVIEEKMQMILELNSENRHLNEVINNLKGNAVSEEPENSKENEKNVFDSQPSNRNERKSVQSGRESQPCIAVFQCKDKENFISESNSSVGNEYLGTDYPGDKIQNSFRARAGHDSNIQATDNDPNKDEETDTAELPSAIKDVNHSNESCQTECGQDNAQDTEEELSLNCYEGEVVVKSNNYPASQECFDGLCPQKDVLSSEKETCPINELIPKITSDLPTICDDDTCPVLLLISEAIQPTSIPDEISPTVPTDEALPIEKVSEAPVEHPEEPPDLDTSTKSEVEIKKQSLISIEELDVIEEKEIEIPVEVIISAQEREDEAEEEKSTIKPTDLEKSVEPSETDIAISGKTVSKTLDEKPGKEIIRCICKSRFCKVIPDPDNPAVKVCVDAIEIYPDDDVESNDEPCICEPVCPKNCKGEKTNVKSSTNRDDVRNEASIYGTEAPTNTARMLEEKLFHTSIQSEIESNRDSVNSRNSSISNGLSKEQEYAGLSRKEKCLKPKKASSAYDIQDMDNDDVMEKDEMNNADLKLIIADLKSKLLDAEDKIEELKSINKFSGKDNNMSLVIKYSDEIDELKKALKKAKWEKEDYELLKQKVKLLEEGKGDTDNITMNLRTADDKITMKSQLKKLSKKTKCYEEVVEFFKEEMSVMSDELLTLQEVLNVSNVNSQEENNKLISAILQLRRINDRLVSHLCDVEKQVVLENQINQINEARINELQHIIGTKNNDLNQHDEIIQDMRRKLSNASKQNADLKKTIKNLTDTVVEIQEGIKSVERDQNKTKTDVTAVESKVCLANGNLEEIKVCIEEKNCRISDLESQLKNNEVSLILANKELEIFKKMKLEAKEKINSLKEQLSTSEKKNKQILQNYNVVVKQLRDYTNLDHVKNYELGHYKNLIEEMKTSLMQLNNGLDKCEATNIHFYEDLGNSEQMRGLLHHTKSNLSIVFEELKKSMADIKRRISEADFKGDLIEGELLKVKESHMSEIQEEIELTETDYDLERKTCASIEEKVKLNQLIKEQREEIEKLKEDLKRQKENECACKRSVSELKNEKMTSNTETEVSQLKMELNKALQRQRLLNEENDNIHAQTINLRKKLTMMEHAYEILKQDNEECKIQLKNVIREKDYINNKNQELIETIEQMRKTHDHLEKQCRYNNDCLRNLELELSEVQAEKDNLTLESQNLLKVVKLWLEEQNNINGQIKGKFQSYSDTINALKQSMMKQVSQDSRWNKNIMQQHFSSRLASGTHHHSDRSPYQRKRSERRPSISTYRLKSPLQMDSDIFGDTVFEVDDQDSRSNFRRNFSYDSSPYSSSKSPSPKSNSLHGDVQIDEINFNDWFSSNYKETDTDIEEVDDDSFINKVQLMTAQVQEANKRWQQKMSK